MAAHHGNGKKREIKGLPGVDDLGDARIWERDACTHSTVHFFILTHTRSTPGAQAVEAAADDLPGVLGVMKAHLESEATGGNEGRRRGRADSRV